VDDTDLDCARYDVVTCSGGESKPKLDLITTHTREVVVSFV